MPIQAIQHSEENFTAVAPSYTCWPAELAGRHSLCATLVVDFCGRMWLDARNKLAQALFISKMISFLSTVTIGEVVITRKFCYNRLVGLSQCMPPYSAARSTYKQTRLPAAKALSNHITLPADTCVLFVSVSNIILEKW